MEAGEIIKILRTKKKLTQEELGNILGVKKSAIQKYESGAIQNLKMDTLRKLCDYFRVAPFMFAHPEKVTDLDALINIYRRELDLTHTVIINLNEKGIDRLESHVKDLIRIDEYTRKTSQDETKKSR